MSNETSSEHGPTSDAVFGGRASLRGASVGSPVFAGATSELDVPAAFASTSGGGRDRIVWFLAIAGALTLLIGAGVLASQAFSGQGGGATPEEAVDALIAALDNEDLIGVGELLDPAERRTIVNPFLDDVVPELIRLGLLSEDFDASGIAGLDFELTDVTYRIEPIEGHPDLVKVFLTGGTAMTTVVGADLPYGEALKTRFGDMIDESTTSTTEDLGDPMSAFTLVERDGRWYVSIWFSVAELSRGSSPMPSFDAQPIALGSASPEAAVEALIAEIVELDIDGMIGRLDPDEMAALYRYSPLFLDEARAELAEAVAEARAQGFEWDITGLEFDVDADGDDAIVSIRSFTATISSPEFSAVLSYSPELISITGNGAFWGETFDVRAEITTRSITASGTVGSTAGDLTVRIDDAASSITIAGKSDGQPFSGSLTLDPSGICSNYRFDGFGQNEQGCLESSDYGAGPVEQLRSYLDNVVDEFPGIDVATYRTDGAWYVSPTGTAMHYFVKGMREMDPETVTNTLGFVPFFVFGGPLMAGELFDIPNFEGDTDPQQFEDIGPAPTTTVVSTLAPASEFEIAVALNSTDEFTETLGAQGRHAYLVDVAEGQTVGVTLYGIDRVEGGISDPFIEIQTPDGQWFDQNDDNDGFNSGLTFTADRSGVWRIVVSDLSGSEGEYQLTVEVVEEGSTPSIGEDQTDPGSLESTLIEDVTILDVTPGSTSSQEGSLSSGGYDVFEIDLAQGDSVVISLEATDGAFDSKLFANDPLGNFLVLNDDALAEAGLAYVFDSQLELTATETGRYSIEVRSFGDIGEGAYTLTVEFA